MKTGAVKTEKESGGCLRQNLSEPIPVDHNRHGRRTLLNPSNKRRAHSLHLLGFYCRRRLERHIKLPIFGIRASVVEVVHNSAK
jgi:hypothetical protein